MNSSFLTRLRRTPFFVLACTLAVGLLGNAPSEAKVYSKFLDAAKFGHLDQSEVECPKFACGPTAATNSFMYLQNKYPDVYGEKLIPPTTAGAAPTKADLVDVANKLGRDYMKTCVPCGPNDGTYIEDFIIGKRAYLEAVAPGKTSFLAQINIGWRFGTDTQPDDAGNPGVKKPVFVSDSTKPTLDFLYAAIARQADVELFLGDHYVTLTGIEYDDATNKGKISFIDPDGGKEVSSKITGIEDGFVMLDYDTSSKVFAAVIEAPVPEPGTWVMLGAGAAIVLVVRIRRGARQG